MKYKRPFIPTAESILPDYMRKDSDDSSKTYEEIVRTYGAVSYGETDTYSPLIRPKNQNGFVYRGGDDDLTLGEAMKKGLAPNGMRPTWSPEARKRYEVCIEPEIKRYKKTVDKINTDAESGFIIDTGIYLSAIVGVPILTEVINGVKGDKVVRTRWRWETSFSKRGFGADRVTFWVTVIIASTSYFVVRRETMRKEAVAFAEATDNLLEKTTECREKNPYDVWVQLTPAELRPNMFLESFRPTRPHQGILYPITKPER